MPRGRPQKNFGLKNFGLIFRSLDLGPLGTVWEVSGETPGSVWNVFWDFFRTFWRLFRGPRPEALGDTCETFSAFRAWRARETPVRGGLVLKTLGLPAVLPRGIPQERKGHINLRKIPGTPAGCPWDTRRDKQGSTGRCPGDFLLFTIEKRTEKGIFAGTPAGCPRDTRPSRRFSENLCDFFLCAFSAP